MGQQLFNTAASRLLLFFEERLDYSSFQGLWKRPKLRPMSELWWQAALNRFEESRGNHNEAACGRTQTEVVSWTVFLSMSAPSLMFHLNSDEWDTTSTTAQVYSCKTRPVACTFHPIVLCFLLIKWLHETLWLHDKIIMEDTIYISHFEDSHGFQLVIQLKMLIHFSTAHSVICVSFTSVGRSDWQTLGIMGNGTNVLNGKRYLRQVFHKAWLTTEN